MPGTRDAALDTVVHRALASPTRSRLLAELRAAGIPMSAQDLAAVTDLHANTVRSHLAILENARLVVGSREGGGRRGRPRHLFAASEAVPSSDDAYRALAAVLAERLRQERVVGRATDAGGLGDIGEVGGDADDTATAVEEAAQEWIERRTASRAGAAQDATSAIDRVLQALHELGFGSRVRGDVARGAEVVVEGCPFEEIVRSHPEVACGFHRGILRGLLRATRELELVHVDEDRDAHRCVAAVRSVP